MAISFDKYVDITSSVGGSAVASNRELMLRLFTTNPLVPTGIVVEFASAAAVGDYFGTLSTEFLQAQFYFGFISKLSTKPAKISFAFWADVATVPLVFGSADGFLVTDFTSIADGSMTVTLGPDVEILTGLNFTAGVASLADVAGVIQAALIATAASVQFTGAVVTYNATAGRFELVGGGPAGAAAAAIADGGVGTEVKGLLGWAAPTVRISAGIGIQTITALLTDSTELTNNFGSLAFVDIITSAEILEAATWNDGENVKFMYLERVLDVDAQTLSDSLTALSGVGITLYDGTLIIAEYPWLAPAAVFAATPYFRRASVQNYMFQQFALGATVTTTALATFYDGLKVNYYGQTQQAGIGISFYQRGFLMGLSGDPIDMGVYANEVFLKDAIGVDIINLLLALPSVPANASGKAQVLAAVQSNIDDALFSGIISIGKTLNSTQIAFITAITGDPNSFLQIQNAGFWIEAVILEPQPSEFVVQYTLLYSKNDVVRKVEGSHILI